ncbi:MAG: polysaccharide pyruvyl transferase family protein [Thermoanaerobaculia bacterium]|jgi:polysaccharide pyruvyl transferase WcaK-like protein
MNQRRRLLVAADVGGRHSRHIGDEAMLEANLEGLRGAVPGAELVVMSRDPEWIEHRYGVSSVPLFGFASGPAAREERLTLMADLCGAAASGAAAGDALDAVRRADAVVVSGGGNLSSTWPHLLGERVTLLLTAHRLGKPAAVLGQTIGPSLTAEERAMLSEALRAARFVGVRELPSAALAMSLGVPLARLWYQSDDAMFAPWIGGNAPAVEPDARATIVVTIDPQLRSACSDGFSALARQLRELAAITGAAITLVPHEFGEDAAAGPSDRREARLLASCIALSEIEIVEDLDARSAAFVAANAALVISTRYHPLVFALAGGAACVGIYGDEYCRIKLQGALAHAGLERQAIRYDDVARGALLPLALESWRDRERARRDLSILREKWSEETGRRWEAIGRALDPQAPEATIAPGAIMGRSGEELVPMLLSAIELGRESVELLAKRREAAERTAIAFQTMARPYLTLRRQASKLRAVLRRLAARS